MKWKSYLIFCTLLAVLIASSVLFMPGLSEFVEAQLISFLSTNAR
jgi:hypothetical protein